MITANEIQKLYFSITNIKALQIERLRDGYTNYSYLINEKHVLRVKKKISDRFYRVQVEHKVINLIKPLKISEKVLYFDEKKGVKLSEYIPKTNKIVTLPTKYQLKQVAKTLKKLHQAKLEVNHSFNVINRLKHYKSLCNIFVNQEYEDQIISRYERYNKQYPTVLCHNDVVRGNLLFKGRKLYLIDFEYASDNNPLFDLASFISENMIEDEEMRKLFLKYYFKKKNSEKKYYHLIKLIELQNILWFYWAQMYYIKTKENVYKKIADDKWAAILKCKQLNF